MRLNAIKAETTTTGTGAVTLTDVSGWPNYDDWLGTTGTRLVRYTILDASSVPIEGGIGTITLSTLSLARTTPQWTWASSTTDNTSPSAVSLASGTKTVICAPNADDFLGSLLYMSTLGDNLGATPLYAYTSITTYTLGHQRVEYIPLWIVKPGPIDRVSIRCTTGYTGGSSSLNASLYEVGSNGRPDARIADFGNLGSLTAATLTSTPITAFWQGTGVIYLALLAQFSGGSGTPAVQACSGIITPTPLGAVISAGSGARHFTVAQVSSQTSLSDPATLTGIAGSGSTTLPFVVFGP
jgi:hypothetical protein